MLMLTFHLVDIKVDPAVATTFGKWDLGWIQKEKHHCNRIPKRQQDKLVQICALPYLKLLYGKISIKAQADGLKCGIASV